MKQNIKFGDKVKIPILGVCGMYIGRSSRGHRIRFGLMDILVTSPPKKAHARKKRPLSHILDDISDKVDDLSDKYLNEDNRGMQT